ncbi:hypothetical protein [Spirochaeta africana]|uniref:Uncharacterized protein n=1 Tax=Spirochaeta africana (strain ATCC 700263 / DSM 8902 / Z-7692) TaxID=889378 RepID=H9UMX5_SPIAZ|nr:hypothetical protein [Spirochaeta africana]AFG38868.1 hypothetical protein Spiaf_2844 [Spirochaeta africana DSM 8902]
MGTYLDQVPEKIQDHIRDIAATSGLPQGEEAVEAIAQGWLQKQELFAEKTAELDMESVDDILPDFERGALLLTYSGSLLTVGPLVGDGRWVEYTSIGLRHDVPDSAESQDTGINQAILLDEPASFTRGPIQQSSPIYRIAIHREHLDPEEEQQRLSSATQIISEGFADVNKTLTLE